MPTHLAAIVLLSLASTTDALCPSSTRSIIQKHPTAPRSVVVLRGGGLATQWQKYLTALEEKPMVTKMATAAFLSGTGDVIAQALEASGAFSIRRFLTLISVNVVYIVPILTFFYAINEWLANTLKLEAGGLRTGVQLAFDQLVNAPCVVAGFFTAFQYATAIAEGIVTRALPKLGPVPALVAAQLRESYVSTLISNWKIWVLPQLLNFAFVPPYGRVAFANVIALVWNVVLSIVANK